MLETNPRVIFSYNLDKDVENIKIGFRATRKGRGPDKEMEKIVEKFGDNPNSGDLKKYLENKSKEENATLELKIEELQNYWDFKGFTLVVVPNGNDWDNGNVRFRNMLTGDESVVPVKSLSQEIGKVLSRYT